MTYKVNDQDAIITDRNGIVENRHFIHVAVVDSTGRLLYTAGDPSRLTLIRSAAKPAQALAILETGCLEEYGFDEADLALICASHSSEDRHITRAKALMDSIGAVETDLRCGPHPANMPEIERLWAKRDFTPTPMYNNCSGKHAGMLAGAKMIGAEFKDYHEPDHAIQLRVKQVVEDLCGEQRDTVQWGNDGCNLPAPALPLHLLGSMFAEFARAADVENHDGTNGSTSNSEHVQGCARVFRAMSRYPEMVAGEGRFCTALMRAYEGALFGKVGACACYGVGVRKSERTRQLGAKGAIGIALKIEDGNIDMGYAAVAEVLERLEIGSADTRKKLASFHKKEVLNTAGVVVGSVHYAFELRPTGA